MLSLTRRQFKKLTGQSLPGKYKAEVDPKRKPQLDGIIFDSQWELRVYQELKFQYIAREIKDLRIKKEKIFVAGRRTGRDTTHIAAFREKPDRSKWTVLFKMVPDFWADGKFIDAKGKRTREFNLKYRMLKLLRVEIELITPRSHRRRLSDTAKQ